MTETSGKPAAELSEAFLSKFDAEYLEQNSVFSEERYDELLGKLSETSESWEDVNCADRRRFCLLYGNTFLAERSNGNLLLRRHQFFDTLLKSHLESEHGDVDSMWKDLQPQYANITQLMIRQFIEICVRCQERAKILAPECVTSAYIEILRFNNVECSCCTVLIYEDVKTCFVVITELSELTLREIVRAITHVFSFFGAACVISARPNNLLPLKDIKELNVTLTNTVVNPSYHRPEQVKIARHYMFEMGKSVSSLNYFIYKSQLLTNTTYNSTLGMTPYEARFGVPVIRGITEAGVDKEVLEKARNDEELKELLRDARARAICGNSQGAITNG